MVKTIQKLKAGISAIIETKYKGEEQEKVIETAKKLYYSNQIIFESVKDKEDYRKHNVFYDFMENEDRKKLEHGDCVKDTDKEIKNIEKYVMSK